jgi:hypothetical protein
MFAILIFIAIVTIQCILYVHIFMVSLRVLVNIIDFLIKIFLKSIIYCLEPIVNCSDISFKHFLDVIRWSKTKNLLFCLFWYSSEKKVRAGTFCKVKHVLVLGFLLACLRFFITVLQFVQSFGFIL